MPPRVRIDLKAISDNARMLMELCSKRSISISGVTKASAGSMEVAQAMIDGGVREIADSRIANLMRYSKLDVKRMLLRPVTPEQAGPAVEACDTSLNTELETIKSLGREALRRGVEHRVIIMVDLGDRREGVMPRDATAICEEASSIDGIDLRGIGTNLACFAGIIPTPVKMAQLSHIAEMVEDRIGLPLETVSGGNSANLGMVLKGSNHHRVNDLRLGESILLGLETVNRTPVPGLRTDAFIVSGDLIEVKEKPSKPDGDVGQDAFGNTVEIKDEGMQIKGIVNLGRQDVDPSDLVPVGDVKVLGGSSDHTLLSLRRSLKVGSSIGFIPGYGSLLRCMTSPYVEKVYV
ncbi:MAG: alanine/ornithine racemase family PLP-dependent enzyme [Candidatus Thermoplasmatota archaeon]|nr:alanine/ornithine racemase family PLP-dependent enzyme [Candidatus Thermoplasmatota archaeon]